VSERLEVTRIIQFLLYGVQRAPNFFTCGNDSTRPKDTAEEYCWAITLAVMLRPIRFQYAESGFQLDSLVYTYRPTVDHGIYSVPTSAKFDLCRTCRNVNYCLSRRVSVHLLEFVVNKVELGECFLRVLRFSPRQNAQHTYFFHLPRAPYNLSKYPSCSI